MEAGAVEAGTMEAGAVEAVGEAVGFPDDFY